MAKIFKYGAVISTFIKTCHKKLMSIIPRYVIVWIGFAFNFYVINYRQLKAEANADVGRLSRFIQQSNFGSFLKSWNQNWLHELCWRCVDFFVSVVFRRKSTFLDAVFVRRKERSAPPPVWNGQECSFHHPWSLLKLFWSMSIINNINYWPGRGVIQVNWLIFEDLTEISIFL